MPTALELTREEWQPYIEAARQQLVPSKLSLAEHHEREELLDRVRGVSSVLKARFGAKRVILFGSLADTAGFTLDSDVDLAVEGVASEAYWQAWQVVEEMIGDREVDLIELETAKESLLRVIQKYGIEL